MNTNPPQNSHQQKNWQDDYRASLRNNRDIQRFFGIELKNNHYDIFIPIHIAKLIKENPNGVLAKQFLPSDAEYINQKDGLYDPIGDQLYHRSGKVIHRYSNRLLFFPTSTCPIICRYCFRKNELSDNDPIFKDPLSETIQYLSNHTEVDEIIFSGGDPLILSNEKLRSYLHHFSTIPHIKTIRFHSRTPVILPNRIDNEFINLIKEFENRFHIIIAIHINHADEATLSFKDSIKLLKENTKVLLLSQSVLLKDINDTHQALIDLFKLLHQIEIRPYYLHHPDKVKGAMHFYLPIEDGKRLFTALRKQLSGWMLPQYILDNPNGNGKTTFL